MITEQDLLNLGFTADEHKYFTFIDVGYEEKRLEVWLNEKNEIDGMLLDHSHSVSWILFPETKEQLTNFLKHARRHARPPAEKVHEFDIDGRMDKLGIEYVGKATLQTDGSYHALAKIPTAFGISLAIVQVKITEKKQ